MPIDIIMIAASGQDPTRRYLTKPSSINSNTDAGNQREDERNRAKPNRFEGARAWTARNFSGASDWVLPFPDQMLRELKSAVAYANQHGADAGVYPVQLAGTTVEVNGSRAPLVYVWATQVAAVVPYSVTTGPAQVTVAYNGRTSASFAAPVFGSAPRQSLPKALAAIAFPIPGVLRHSGCAASGHAPGDLCMSI
jgi:hypothetical protein